MACYCDYEAPEFYKAAIRKARKAHRCNECACVIRPGERYEYVSGMWDGDISTNKTCSRCLELRQYTQGHVPCFCWFHGEMVEEAIETLREYAHELPGLLFGGYRRKVLIERNESYKNYKGSSHG
jgi:hypothetical protein